LQGARGVAGKNLLVGDGAPGNGTGTNGDTYLDFTTGNFYGPKSAGAWPVDPFGRLLDIDPTGGSTGDVLTQQVDGSFAPAPLP
jgi:hypothetical protein